MARANTASVRIGGLAAIMTLIFWSVWSCFAPVPVVSEILLTPEYSIVLPQVMVPVLGISLWSRWLDTVSTGFFVALLTQVIMRADDKAYLGIGLISSLFSGALLLAIICDEFGLFVGMLAFGLIFGLVAGLGAVGAGLGAGVGANLLGAGLIFGPVFGLGAGLIFGLAYLCSQFFRRKLWRAVRRWLTAQE